MSDQSTTSTSPVGRGLELEREFNDICRSLDGDLESRLAADAWLGTTDALYHGAPCSWAMTPKIFTTQEAAWLADIAETTGRIMDKVTQRFLESAEFRAEFALDPWMEELCQSYAGYEQLIPISRVDIFLNEETGEFQFCEWNTDGSAGINATVEITRAIQSTDTYREFARRHPGVSTYDIEAISCAAVLETYRSWEHAGEDGHPAGSPALVFVDYDESASHGEVDSLIRRYRELGVAARFADVHELEIREVDGRQRLCDSQGPIDCIWRRAVTSEMAEKPCAGRDAMIRAGQEGICCVVGSFRTWPCATKTVFAVLWSDAIKDVLTPEELEFVHAHVPRTYILSPESDLAPFADKDRWIAKPAGGYNAVGVLAGLDATPEQWQAELEATAASCGVVQEYCRQYATPMVFGGRLPEGAGYTDLEARRCDTEEHAMDFSPAANMEGLFLFNGKFGGIYTRCGYEATIGEWTNRFHMGCLVVDESEDPAC